MRNRKKSKTNTAQSSAIDLGDQGEEDEYVTIAMVKQLLKVQESILQSLFESVVNSLQTRLDNVVISVQEIKTSLEFTQKTVEQLEPLQSSIAKTNEDVKRLNADLSSHSLSLEYLENQSRRNNIRVNGILESPRETWEEARRRKSLRR